MPTRSLISGSTATYIPSYISGAGSGGPSSRSTLRLREKYILFLVLATFLVFCVGGFFFLPELKAGTQFAYKQIRDAGPDLLGLIPPVDRGPQSEKLTHPHESREHLNAALPEASNYVFPIPITARAKLTDMQKLADKIKSEMNAINLTQLGAVLPKPFQVNSIQNPSPDQNVINDRTMIKGEDTEENDDWEPLALPIGEDQDEETKKRRDVVKEMMKHAWNNYERFAWGENELRPISKRGHSAGIFGKTQLGATIVDAMDTLWIMGLKDDFRKGREWIDQNVNLDNVQSDISVFETNIRFVGGLLTCYAFTKDKMFLERANHIAEKLLPAFNTPKGLPNALINPKTGYSKNYGWASSGSSILSEIGTLHLEFVYLSDLTKNPIFKEKVFHIRNFLNGMHKPNGLYPNYINPKTGRWGQHHISMGALGDSFYEYLLKAWVQSGGRDIQARKMYDEAIVAIEKNLLQKSTSGLLYLADMKYDRLEHKMDHLTCFAGGIWALGAQSLNKDDKEHHMKIGAGLTHTCHESYRRTPVGLGPESFRFSENVEAKATRQNEKYYIQRPEVIESYFYLWRLTKDQKYRNWAWEATEALQKYCRDENGFSGLKNVYDPNGPKDDVQQSFFLAETLKYLYLIFSDDSLISFEEWVFNTEAHPFPIRGRNPAYPLKLTKSKGDLPETSLNEQKLS